MSTRPPLGSTMSLLRPAPGVLAFYDGRTGSRAYSDEANWVDDGAYEVGIASYALVDQGEALVYDTHTSMAHARLIRSALEGMGVRKMTVVLSHWHLDHIAGNGVFADCEIIAHVACAEAMAQRKEAIEAGTEWGQPPIDPLVMPTRTFETEIGVRVGALDVSVRHADIHSCDGAVLMVPERGLLLAGDTLEDTVTYVAEPEGLERHLAELGRMARWPIGKILPNHGAAERIAQGGYEPTLIAATQRYVERLIRCRGDAGLAATDLRAFVADELEKGWITWFEPYAQVHRDNVALVLGATRGAS